MERASYFTKKFVGTIYDPLIYSILAVFIWFNDLFSFETSVSITYRRPGCFISVTLNV